MIQTNDCVLVCFMNNVIPFTLLFVWHQRCLTMSRMDQAELCLRPSARTSVLTEPPETRLEQERISEGEGYC